MNTVDLKWRKFVNNQDSDEARQFLWAISEMFADKGGKWPEMDEWAPTGATYQYAFRTDGMVAVARFDVDCSPDGHGIRCESLEVTHA